MRILALGHSCFLLEMNRASDGEPVRILADPWLSDCLAGDLQGRFPRIRFDAGGGAPIDAVFVSHSHTDHLDPYSLVRLWRELDPHPKLLLPESLRFLAGLLREHLANAELVFLCDGEPVDVNGLAVSGYFNPETAATNEDDVMILVAQNGTEVFLSECDAVLPLYHPGGRAFVKSILEEEAAAETICFLTTKNEGEATMSMLAAKSLEERQERVGNSLDKLCQEIQETYEDLGDDDDDLWRDPRLVRVIAGQGICFPQELETDWNRVLFPIRICDRVRIERETAAAMGCRHSIEELLPGSWHEFREGRLIGREGSAAVQVLDRESERDFDPSLALFESFPDAPLRDDERERAEQAAQIETILNLRFLPHLIGARNPPVEHLLAANGGSYRIRVRYGTSRSYEDADYELTFQMLRFRAADVAGDPDELYWANDLDDFLAGPCDEFSTICRHPLGGAAQRLWCCLGLPYLNNDLVEKKLRYHFERATAGDSLSEWVLAFYR